MRKRQGYTKLSSPTTYSRELSVYKLIVHKDYDKFYRQGSDIVLMQLESPVEFSSHILPACVPDKNTTIPSHKACWASGWGHLREDATVSLPTACHSQASIIPSNLDAEKSSYDLVIPSSPWGFFCHLATHYPYGGSSGVCPQS
uniref:Peptidase S1 domain-containing protein n=1 Tax=Peromyscus maniculatus bairdii TaxID=230844 RepID=A0A8C8UM23_PERMB